MTQKVIFSPSQSSRELRYLILLAGSWYDYMGYEYMGFYGVKMATNYIIAILITVIKGVGVSDSSSRQLVCRPTNATTLKTLLTHYCFTIQACGTLFLHFTPNPTNPPTTVLLYKQAGSTTALLYTQPNYPPTTTLLYKQGGPTTTLLHKQVDLTTVHPQYPTTHPLPFCNTSNMNPLQYQQYLPTYHFSIYTLFHLIPLSVHL